VRYNHIWFDIDVAQATTEGTIPEQIAHQTGHTGFVQLYSQSSINLTPGIVINSGVNINYLLMNNNFSIEPRLGVKYDINPKNSIAMGYGIHSRMEQLPVYFVTVNGTSPNKDLEFMKSHHYVLSYQAKIAHNVHLTIEPYYQQLKDVPVSPNDYHSTLNNQNMLFFSDAMINEGVGHNVGIEEWVFGYRFVYCITHFYKEKSFI